MCLRDDSGAAHVPDDGEWNVWAVRMERCSVAGCNRTPCLLKPDAPKGFIMCVSGFASTCQARMCDECQLRPAHETGWPTADGSGTFYVLIYRFSLLIFFFYRTFIILFVFII